MSSLETLQRPVRAVLFDVYGTLVKIQRVKRPYRQLLDEARMQHLTLQKEQSARDIMCQSLGLSEAAKFYGVELSPSQLCDLERDLEEEVRSLTLFPEVPEVLRILRDRGYRLGVCSNLAAPYVAPVAHLLEGMVDAAIWSCEVGVMKPDRAIYELAASRLDTAPAELLMVGDSKQADVRGPRAAGLRALHLDRRTGGGDLTALDGLLSWLSGSDAVTSQVK